MPYQRLATELRALLAHRSRVPCALYIPEQTIGKITEPDREGQGRGAKVQAGLLVAL